MADDSWPSPNHNSRAVTSAELDSLLSAYVPDGLVGSPADLDIIYCDSSGRNVKVRAARYGVVNGRLWYSGASALQIDLDANASGSNRYDLIVARYNRTTYDIRATKITGTPGSGIPSPVDNASYLDLSLGNVLVPPGATSLAGSAAKVTAYYLGSSLYTAKSGFLPPHAPMRIVLETDTGKVKFSTGSTWVTIYQDSSWLSLTLGSGFTLPSGGYGTAFRAVGGAGFLSAEVQRSGSLAANSRAVVASFDSQYAPGRRLPIPLWAASDSGDLTVVSGKVTVPWPRMNATIQTNGTVTLDAHPSLASGALIIIPLASWPVGG